jgi:hypothetical protein
MKKRGTKPTRSLEEEKLQKKRCCCFGWTVKDEREDERETELITYSTFFLSKLISILYLNNVSDVAMSFAAYS